MIVPRYWSESKAKRIVGDRQFTVKRFGWSDDSEQDAKEHADTRLSEAMEALEKDGDVRRIDHKTSYNGAEGIPIREEVISKHQDVVISRNSYGALCLNTPDVLFADIDFEYEASFRAGVITFVFFAAAIIATALLIKSWAVLLIGLFFALILSSTLANTIYRVYLGLNGGAEKIAIQRVKQVAGDNVQLNIRLYKTPMGLRVLLMNDTYYPSSDNAINILKSLKSDKTYTQMCKNQNCFRARVSPKPWRIGVDRLKPNPGVWPIKIERMSERISWVASYENKAESYSSCHFILQIGGNQVNDKAEFVRNLHDQLCKVDNPSATLA